MCLSAESAAVAVGMSSPGATSSGAKPLGAASSGAKPLGAASPGAMCMAVKVRDCRGEW